jgi:1-acyl-sn-glycerol-3-phosphate acyltransferase
MAVNSLEHEQVLHREYDHARFEGRRRFLRFLIKYIGFTLLAKANRVEGIENVPSQGPAILMINHIAFIDPIFVLHVLPRNIVPLAKMEVYEYPVVGIFPKIWGVIPVRRDEVDRRAITQVMQVLRAGEIVLVAPEGTRGPALKQGKEGVAYLASRSGAPVVPVAIQGTHGFPAIRFTSPWRGPGASVCFGKPFRYRAAYRHAGREDLRRMTDEAMYILSALLPPEQRGIYADLSLATQETIEWVSS